MSTRTGFQHGRRVPSGWAPVAISMGAVQVSRSCRDSQMPTSAAPSRVPPNQAVTSPSRVSTIVDACALVKGAVSNTNSESTEGTIMPTASTIVAGSTCQLVRLALIEDGAIVAQPKIRASVARPRAGAESVAQSINHVVHAKLVGFRRRTEREEFLTSLLLVRRLTVVVVGNDEEPPGRIVVLENTVVARACGRRRLGDGIDVPHREECAEDLMRAVEPHEPAIRQHA